MNTKKIKTSELTPVQINWVVATIEDHDPYLRQFQGKQAATLVWLDDFNTARYATDWAQGGPIIERMMRDGLRLTGYTCLPTDPTHCQAQIKGIVTGGPTPLIAAMRCYVASKLGDEVEIPEVLL